MIQKCSHSPFFPFSIAATTGIIILLTREKYNQTKGLKMKYNATLPLMHCNCQRILRKCKHGIRLYCHNKGKMPIIKMVLRFRKLHMMQRFTLISQFYIHSNYLLDPPQTNFALFIFFKECP